jgi:hypothetical protein
MFGTFPATEVASSPAAEAAKAATPSDNQAEVTKEVETANTDEQSASSTTESEVTADSTDTDNVGDSSETETESTAKPKRGFERRIEKFNQRLSAKDQEIEYWKRVALQQGAAEPKQEPAASNEKPKFSDYNDIEAYTEALTDWKLGQTLQQVKQQSTAERMAQTYEQRLAEFRKEQPDFDEVVSEFVEEYGQEQIPEIVAVAMESEVGPRLAYYLAQNVDEVERLQRLPSHRRFLELGKIEDRLLGSKQQTQEKPAEAPKISRAPQPVKSVKGTAKVESYDLRDPSLSYSEWVKRREASLRK